MPSVSLNVKHQISNVIKKFKFEELEIAVLPIFPELSWYKIKSKLIKNHESFTITHAVRIIEEEMGKVSISDKTLKDRLATLEVVDVSRHYKRKTWYSHEFKGKRGSNFMTLREIQVKMKESFDVYHMDVDVRAVQHNGIVFLSIKDRPKKKQIKTIQPTYFSLIMNENFFFCSKKIILKNFLMAVTESMGYKSCKQIKLMGRDIQSLLQLLLARKNAVSQSDIVQQPLQFKKATPVSSSYGLDFTQYKQRKKYAEKCFGKDSPIFEVLKINSADQKWKQTDAIANLPNSVIYTGIEFRSTSIPNLMKNLITQRILSMPLPYYATSMLSLGRNTLTIKED